MKPLCILVLISITSSLLFSQAKIAYGVKAGATIINPTVFTQTRYLRDMDGRVGSLLGLFLEYHEDETVSLVTELYYVHRLMDNIILKYDYNTGEIYQDLSNKVSLDYLNISLLAKFSFSIYSQKLYGFVGPALDIEVDSAAELIEGNNYFDKNSLNTIKYAIKFGIGTEFESMGEIFLTDFSYQFDFNRMSQRSPRITVSSFDIKIGVFL
ncbi:MAG: PorT family protein [Bacteroidetes bacterium]|nr:PorT family protein [Bacteroidota bacterium]